MSLMSKLSMSLIAASLLASAGGFDPKKFVERSIVTNPQIKVESVDTIMQKQVPDAKDWQAYMVVMNLNYHNKSIKAPETIFVNEKAGLATMDLFRISDGHSIKKDMKPDITPEYYDDAHLIYGNKNAKHKLVIFSDPDCPFCRASVPDIIKDVKASPDLFALYYYHMPLVKLHPVSDVLTRVMEVLQKQGRMDDALKMYQLKISYREKNPDKILSEIKKQFGIEVSKGDIDKPEIKKAIKSDMDKAAGMMVNGTPSVFYDNKFDDSRIQYKSAIIKHQ